MEIILKKTNQFTLPSINIVYKLDTIKSTRNIDFTIQNALFGAVKINEDPSDSDHNKYSGYEFFFDSGSNFSFCDVANDKNVAVLN